VINRIISAPVSTLKPGDTVQIDGVWKTVCARNLSHCPFMGAAVWGDVRALQGRMIDVVLFPKWDRGELIGHVRQP